MTYNMNKKQFLDILISLILITILAVSYFLGIGKTEFHRDESQWIGSSQVFEEFFTGKFNSP